MPRFMDRAEFARRIGEGLAIEKEVDRHRAWMELLPAEWCQRLDRMPLPTLCELCGAVVPVIMRSEPFDRCSSCFDRGVWGEDAPLP